MTPVILNRPSEIDIIVDIIIIIISAQCRS